MTVVVPTRNRAALLRRLLSCFADEIERDPGCGDGLEFVVVLDGTFDASERVVSSFSRRLTVRCVTQEHRGLASARNTGMRFVRGGLVWFFDDDEVPGRGSVR